jgi:2-methylisocitrate lyase-like PEP mutase family enzyme
MVIHGITPMMRAARAIRDTLAALRRDELEPDVDGVTFEEYKKLVGFDDWASVDDRFADAKTNS